MINTAAAIILSLVCAVSYQALGDEIDVKSLNRSSTGFFVFSPDFVRIKPGTRSTLSLPIKDMKFTRSLA